MTERDPEKAVPAQTSSSPAASTYSNEKGRVSEVERASDKGDHAALHGEMYNAHVDVSGVDEKKLIRKLDWYLVPWLSFLYLLSFLDRTSIGNAKVRLRVGEGLCVSVDSGAQSCIIWRQICISQTSST